MLRALARVLSDAPAFHVWATVTSAEGALTVVTYGGFDGVVTNLTLPGAGGLDLVQRLRAQGATMPILVVGGGARGRGASAVLAAGAQALVPRVAVSSALVPALHRALGLAAERDYARQVDRRWRGTTSLMPDHTALMAHTLQSTSPAARPAA